MGTCCIYQHSKVCSVPTNCEHRCPYDQFCICLHLGYVESFLFYVDNFSCWPFSLLSASMVLVCNIFTQTCNVPKQEALMFPLNISGSAPLTAVQLLWVNLIMDTLGALALATEPPHEGLMNRPPVGRDVSFITMTMWRNIIGQSVYQLAVLLVFNFLGKQLLNLEGSNATRIQNTFIFNTFVFCQVCLICSLV